MEGHEGHAALVLTGGGARAAYQVGVLNAIRELRGKRTGNPFPILCGTSAGAINAVALAVHAGDFGRAVRHIDRIWRGLHVHDVYRVDPAALLDLVIDGVATDIQTRHTRGCPFINAAAEYPDQGPVHHLIAAHRAWFRGTLRALADGADLDDPDAVAAGLVLLRDAAMVGGYLDGRDVVAPAFSRTARELVAAHRQ